MSLTIQDHVLKCQLLMIGDSGVGKTSILLRFTDNTFSCNFVSTIGLDSKRKTVIAQGKKVEITLWDTAGQERFSSITPASCRGVDGVVFVFDVTNPKSLKRIIYWSEVLEKEVDTKHVKKLLIGNKIDMEEDRKVQTNEGLKMAEKYQMLFYETSAKENSNIDKAFLDIANVIATAKTEKNDFQTHNAGSRNLNNTSNSNSNSRVSKCLCD